METFEEIKRKQQEELLKAEKERGISIDLGFAHFDLPDGTHVGVVDVHALIGVSVSHVPRPRRHPRSDDLSRCCQQCINAKGGTLATP